MTLTALLQARDEAGELPGWLANVAPCVDAIVALDDGSVDATGAILESHPKVARLLRNPPGKPWDERSNQVALVKAAREFGDWALAIDADERLELRFAGAAAGLIEQAMADGIDCLCFSLRELWGDRRHYRVDGDWGRKTRYRLFRNDRAHRRFDPRPLHRFWMPMDIALNIEARGRHSGYNLYHLSMVEQAARERRVRRYEALDPQHRYQSIGYAYLADERGLELEAIPPGRNFLPAESA
jgi:glycosyltransferase involved in cell wall biosynthesis